VRRLLASQADHAHALLRFFAGGMFACHGAQKIFGLLAVGDHGQQPVGTLGWWAGVIELVCGFAVALGLFTRPMAFVASGEMAVAYFQAHAKPPTSAEFFPIVNGGELAVLYCFVFLWIACRGAGPWSIDGRLRRTTVTSAPPPRAPSPPRERVTAR